MYDSVRKSVELIASVYNDLGMSTWRQSKSLIKKLKNRLRKFQKMRHSNSKDEQKQQNRIIEIKETCTAFMKQSEHLLYRVLASIRELRNNGTDVRVEVVFAEITRFIEHAERQLNQIQRRVINGEKIPHTEKVFSVFEEYTQWLVKGKAGVSQELGLNVCIIEDQFGYILNHQIMQNEVDKSIVVSFTQKTKKLFPAIKSCSFDKGFWSPGNYVALDDILDEVILPKKGRLSLKDKERESTEQFGERRKKHSAVESGINALENHGLDRCPDKGSKAFHCYISFAVLARNIQILGNFIQEKEIARKKRSTKMKQIKKLLAA